MRRLLLPLLLTAGCHTPFATGLADPLGGVSVEDAAFVGGGTHLLLSTRYADGPVQPVKWHLHRLADGRTLRLTDDRDPVYRWTDSEVWPSPDGCLLAVVQADEIRIFDIREERFIVRLDREVEATLALLPWVNAPRHAEFADLFAPPDRLLHSRRFWALYQAEYCRAATPVAVDLTPAPPGPAVTGLDIPPQNHVGNPWDRYGYARGLTDVDAGGRRVFDSHRSQFFRNAAWVVGLPADVLTAAWQKAVADQVVNRAGRVTLLP